MVMGQERPPFEPGNQVAKTHGTYSEVEIAKRAEEVHGALLEIAPWVSAPQFAPSVDRYLKACARETLAHEALMSMEPGAKGFTRLMEAATAASRLAWFMGDALGLTPAGHARLKLLVAGVAGAEAALADLAAEGRKALGSGESEPESRATLEGQR